ncbi:MAG: hypothetical protein GY774_05895 [Planctomycetes bacterium]|nr:hypothetical protein [Planctomycetota bacterium]
MQEVTDSVVEIMAYERLYCLAYIDDLAGANRNKHTAEKAFFRCADIMAELGLVEAVKKTSPPTKHMTWLGIHFDTRNMTMTIPTDKIREIHDITVSWKNKNSCTQTQLKSLLGKLFFAATCSNTLRLFSNRLLATLRANYKNARVMLDEEFHHDIEWIIEYLVKFNGKDIIEKLPTCEHELTVDSCLIGGGEGI